MSRLARSQDLQALHRRRSSRARSPGRTVRGRGAERRPRLAQGRARCRRRRPARRFPKWAGATPYNRGQVLYRLAEMMETRAADLGACVLGPARGRARDRSGRLVRGLGRQAAAGARRLEPGRRAVLQLHGAGADGRRRGPRARSAAARRARLADRPGDREREHGGRRHLGDAAARGARARRGDRDVRSARAASSTSSPATAPSSGRSSPPTWT